METIVKQVIEETKALSEKFANSKKTEEFEKISKQFEDLVDKGFVQKRGNHLLSPTDAHVKNQVWFNAKYNHGH